MRLFACLIVAPQRGYDEPATLSYAISSFCPTSADGLQQEEWLGDRRTECLGGGQIDDELRGLPLRHARRTAKRAAAGAARGTTRGIPSSSRAAPTARAACTSTPRRSCRVRPSAARRSHSSCTPSRDPPRARARP